MTRVRRAVILAAGTGSRLGAAGTSLPKCLIPVAGVPILHRTLRSLADAAVEEVVLVVGYRKEDVVASVGATFAGMSVSYVESDRYETTNNAYSLWLAREHLDRDLFLIEGDVVVGPDLLAALQAADANAVAVAAYQPWMHGAVVEVDDDMRIERLIEGAEQGDLVDLAATYKTVNAYLLERAFLQEEFVPDLDELVRSERLHEYYETVLKETLARGRHVLRGVDCSGMRWQEVDDATDRIQAEYTFSDPAARLALIEAQHGGYWRHGVTDHALLYNVHFPPRQMRRDLHRQLDDALTHYPVGQSTLASIASGTVRHAPDRIAVGNGASELITVLGRVLHGHAVVPVPGFNEYERSLQPRLTRFELPRRSFRLDVEAFDAVASRAGARLAIITSPNNPTSLAVPPEDLLALCERLGQRECTLVVDESFVDFCRDPRSQTLEHQVDDHPNLVILKSLSKVCGAGGVRLGYLLSANVDLVRRVREGLPIWNVNGVAETFLRLLPRYRKSLVESCALVRRECDELARALQEIPGVDVCPPDANFVFVRLPEGWSGPDVVRRLFVSHNLLIKDCSGKSMTDGDRYLRIASRTHVENMHLVEAFAALVDQGPGLVHAATRSGGSTSTAEL